MPDPAPVSAPGSAPATATQLLRHALATLAYRAAKVLKNVPDDFPDYRPSPSSRSPLEVLSHLGDLMEWGERMAHGEPRWQPGATPEWTAGRARFFRGLAALDAALREPDADPYTAVILQGPVADALTHVGQLSMMRGMVGASVRPESYARAAITVGQVGLEQEAPRAEFDGDASAPPGPR